MTSWRGWGVTRTPSAKARSGCSQTSTISSSYPSFRCRRQIASRLGNGFDGVGSLACHIQAHDNGGDRRCGVRVRFSSFARLHIPFAPLVRGLGGSAARVRFDRDRFGGHGASAAHSAQLVFAVTRGRMTSFVISSVKCQFRSLLVEVQLQGCYPRGDIGLGKL